MNTTKFNAEDKITPTYGECLGPAMEITDQDDADQYLEAYTAHIQGHLDDQPRDDDMTAEEIAKVNLGYYAGYYGGEVQPRVNRLFNTKHPIFGNTL